MLTVPVSLGAVSPSRAWSQLVSKKAAAHKAAAILKLIFMFRLLALKTAAAVAAAVSKSAPRSVFSLVP
jgi:hypothetical protein